MTNLLYVVQVDTTHLFVKELPNDLIAVMGYDTGTSDVQWTQEDWDHFTGASKVHVDQSPDLEKFQTGISTVADVERGAATMQQFLNAAKVREAHNLDSTLYISLGNLAVAKADVSAHALTGRVRYFPADYSFSEQQARDYIDANGDTVGLQFANVKENPNTIIPGTNKTLSDINVDLSVKRADWWQAPAIAGTCWTE